MNRTINVTQRFPQVAFMTEDEFYQKIPGWLSDDRQNWNHITLLAYFCQKYEKVNGVRFRLVKSKAGPTLGKEAADFAKLYKSYLPDNWESLSVERKNEIRSDVMRKLYNFINWMLDYKLKRMNTSVNGTRVFLVPSFQNEFERMYMDFLAKQKSQNKFQILMNWAKNNIPDLFLEHQIEEEKDLKMIEKYIERYKLDDSSLEKKLLNKAKEIGI
jgi:hypothetical protein